MSDSSHRAVYSDGVEWTVVSIESIGDVAAPVNNMACIRQPGGKWQPAVIQSGKFVPFAEEFDTVEEAIKHLDMAKSGVVIEIKNEPHRHVSNAIVSAISVWAMGTVWAIDLRYALLGAVMTMIVGILHDSLDAAKMSR
jgi:hypothetical protein